MPALAELQRAMGRAILAGDAASRALPGDWFQGDATAALKVHRNTVVGACCAALRLSFPTLDRVLGTACFEQLAAEYTRSEPPVAPALDEYGAGFGAFVAARAAAADAPLLRAVADYDWWFERVAQARAGQFNASPAASLDGGLQLHFATSLRLVETRYAVELMREALACAITPGAPRTLALWRREQGVTVKELPPVAAAFVAALLRGEVLEQALQLATTAAADADPTVAAADVASVIAREVLPADFVRLQPRSSQA